MANVLLDDLTYENSRLYTYQGSLFTGTAYEYFADGSVASEINIFEGKEHGVSKDFYPSGKVKYQVNYVHGLKEDVESEWYESGALKEENMLRKGYLMESKKWSESGELLDEYVRPDDDPIFEIVAKLVSGGNP